MGGGGEGSLTLAAGTGVPTERSLVLGGRAAVGPAQKPPAVEGASSRGPALPARVPVCSPVLGQEEVCAGCAGASQKHSPDRPQGRDTAKPQQNPETNSSLLAL